MRDDQFAGYAYAYPHKTSYRPLEPPVRLAEAWRWEDKTALFLYVHIPFCEVRCGFCNLFSASRPERSFVARTLDAIERQSETVAAEVKPENASVMAVGGGTPSFLSVEELDRLFRGIETAWPVDWNHVRVSFETSPATIDAEKLSLLKSYGVERISMGVQGFSADDLRHLGRRQSPDDVEAAIAAIRDAGFPIFNLDLIYGVDSQTEQNWQRTVERAIATRANEIYLYPLYVRKATGLDKNGRTPSARRRALFLTARDALLAAGFHQESMRFFRRHRIDTTTDYCCQDDGMIGLGPGARSYTRSLHYSFPFAVSQTSVKRIIADFNARPRDQFALAHYGVWLDREEQRRRYLIKSLLRASGLELPAYRARFQGDVEDDFPQLAELRQLGLGVRDEQVLRLTSEGLSWSDVVGPWLYSSDVTARMEAFELV